MEEQGYPLLPAARKTGGERFRLCGQPLDTNLLDFWRWSASDLVSNATRGRLAEFIVASALGVAAGVRSEWDAYDLLTPDGVKVEVKSAAYLQSWYHAKPSAILFQISPTRLWNAATNALSEEVKRQADVYVFCHLHHKDKATLDPLNLDQWAFFVLAASVLNEQLPYQKTLSLGRLFSLKPYVAEYETLGWCVSDAAGLSPAEPPVLPEHLEECERRLTEYERNPVGGLSLQELRQAIEGHTL